jgi:hypothetical protein
MSTVALWDVDEGSGSVQNLIDSGRVVRYDCSSYEKCEKVYWGFFYKQYQADLIVLDSMSQQVTTLLQEIAIPSSTLNPSAGKTIWNLSKNLDTRKIYQDATFKERALITRVRDLPIPSIFTVHEVEREDPLEEGEVERRLPALPPKIMEHVLAKSDIIMRLHRSVVPSQYGGKVYPANTLWLQLKSGANVYTGLRLTPDATAALEPTIPILPGECGLLKLAHALGKLPKSMTVYGLPKVGKTVFSCTLPV